MSEKPRYPIALVGVGKIARDQHIPSIARSGAFNLAATVSRSGGLPDVPNFGTIEELLAQRPEIPAVSLCAPPQVRYAQAAAAIQAGKHVLLEKPPGATLGEVHSLTTLADRAGVTLFATWHSRFAPAVELARAWVAERQVSRVTITWKEDVRRWHPGQEWIWHAGGFGVFDPGINALSILTEIIRHPLFVTQARLEVPENCQTPIAATMTITDRRGTPMNVEFDWRQEGPQTWDIIVEAGEDLMKLSSGGSVMTVNGETVAEQPEAEYDGIYKRFGELLDGRTSDVDVSPLRLVADAFLMGERKTTAAFHD